MTVEKVREGVQSSTRKSYIKTMETVFNKVPQHTHLYKSSCGTKFIDMDSRGWKLYAPSLGKWTYFSTFSAAKAAA